jgi:hypothetical protein
MKSLLDDLVFIMIAFVCSSLKALMKQNVVHLPAGLAAGPIAPAVAAKEETVEEPVKKKRPTFPMPDTEQMLPFKPKAIVGK